MKTFEHQSKEVKLNQEETSKLKNELITILNNTKSQYEKSKEIARKFLGTKKFDDNNTQFGVWVPGLKDGLIQGKEFSITLELFTLLDSFSYKELKKGESRELSYRKDVINLIAVDEFLIGIVENVKVGTKESLGSLYWLKYIDDSQKEHIIRDPLAQSVPLGVYAPAEVYDIAGMLKNRQDSAYFKTHFKAQNPDGSFRAKDIGITLEIHPETATQEGTLEALTGKYKSIAEKIRSNIENNNDKYSGLSKDELNFVGFDTVELTPEVPPVEREGINSQYGEFFEPVSCENELYKVKVKKPDISDWGYDTPIIATGAVNPSILGTGRPDEFLEFVETLHNMPDKPIQISLDAVLGHADFQGARLLETFDKASCDPNNLKYTNSRYFRGPNMYGRDMNYADPMVRAILLEMYQRKVDLGFDCVRVDGGQDFVKTIDPETGFRIQDDEFINEMVNVEQNINGIKRRLDMNVEDGRPWPNDMNWLYNATYIEHIMERTLPFNDTVKQWGSLIFAHNVHGKFKWFQSKWDRFKDTFKEGSNWITGHSNHDNARYFYRLVKTAPGSLYKEGESFDEYYNDQFGETMPEATHTALDNGALSAVALGFLPGSPMFFLNALFRTPWLFFRNIDSKYGVKVVADEGGRFLNWYVDDVLYNKEGNFERLKKLGFKSLKQLVSNPNGKELTGFMDILFEKHEKIKTDPVMVLNLYDSPEALGSFRTVKDIENRLNELLNPVTNDQKELIAKLNSNIAEDVLGSVRKIEFTRKMLNKSLSQLDEKESADIVQKINYLIQLDDKSLQMLIEDSSNQDSYDISQWAKDKALNKIASNEMKENGTITGEKLKEFAMAFMNDAVEVCNVSKYEKEVDEDKVKYNFALRQYRLANPWLLENPTNDIKKDFFNRKIITNGAKDLGAFFSDKGDTINSNTIYYGWRTNPNNGKKIFVIANMEGKPLARLSLNQFFPFDGEMKVVVKSPELKSVSDKIDRNYILEDFKNTEAMILEMD